MTNVAPKLFSLVMPDDMRRATEYSPRAPNGPRFYTRPPHSSNLKKYVDKAQSGLGVDIAWSAVPKDEPDGAPYGAFWGPNTGDPSVDAQLEARIIKYYGLEFERDMPARQVAAPAAVPAAVPVKRAPTTGDDVADDRPSLEQATAIKGSGNRPKYPFARMTKVGDSFVVTGRDLKHMKSCVASFLRDRGLFDVVKFAYHEVPAGLLIVALETVENVPRYLVEKESKS